METAGSRTRDVSIANPTPYCYTSALRHHTYRLYIECICLWTTFSGRTGSCCGSCSRVAPSRTKASNGLAWDATWRMAIDFENHHLQLQISCMSMSTLLGS